MVAQSDLLPYQPPSWMPDGLSPTPASRLRLGHLPTPVHKWSLPLQGVATPNGLGVAAETELWIKRDDFTGSELSGNKVRKLEFLLADALEQQCDCVITVGGIQSNHARASAAAARRVGLEPHLILRTSDPDNDPGLSGNLMLDRMVGAKLHLVGDEEFNAKGQAALLDELRQGLIAEGRAPYVFPSGGSNPLGTVRRQPSNTGPAHSRRATMLKCRARCRVLTAWLAPLTAWLAPLTAWLAPLTAWQWGYVQAVAELLEQQEAGAAPQFDRVYFACGSGGTAAGLALAMHCSGLTPSTELVGLGVDDSPTLFHNKINGIFLALGADVDSEQVLRLCDCVGDGYGVSTTEELGFLIDVARSTGVVLDPVYSGKAALGMAKDLQERPVKRALFMHTGGLLGLYAKESQLAPLLCARES